MKHENPVNKSDEWFTPPEILAPLGEFDLDPCGSHRQPWPTAARTLTRREDGLSAEWRGRVWLNPPYGKQAAAWLAKLAVHGRGTALIFARTETQMFFDSVWGSATAILFLRGRIKFYWYETPTRVSAGDRSPAPSVLIAYGPEDAEQLRGSGLNGYFVDLRPDRVWTGWRAAVATVLRHAGSPLVIAEIYRAIVARFSRPNNNHIRAKVRQTLYVYDDFRRVSGNRWVLSAST